MKVFLNIGKVPNDSGTTLAPKQLLGKVPDINLSDSLKAFSNGMR
jgi:hypothetical protein